MTDTQLANIAPPADAIETLNWGICPCGGCDALTRVFITFRDGIDAEDGSRIVVELTGVQEPDDEYRRDLASVRVEGVDGSVGSSLTTLTKKTCGKRQPLSSPQPTGWRSTEG